MNHRKLNFRFFEGLTKVCLSVKEREILKEEIHPGFVLSVPLEILEIT